MKMSIHYNIGSFFYILTLWTQIICWPIALILSEYSAALVAVSVLLFYFWFTRAFKARCFKCFSGKLLRKPVSIWNKELWIKKRYTRYRCNSCGAIKDYDENIRGVINY